MLRQLTLQESVVKSNHYSTRFKDGLDAIIRYVIPNNEDPDSFHINAVHPMERILFSRLHPLNFYQIRVQDSARGSKGVAFRIHFLDDIRTDQVVVYNGDCKINLPSSKVDNSHIPPDFMDLIDQFIKNYYFDYVEILLAYRRAIIEDGLNTCLKRHLIDYDHITHTGLTLYFKERLLNL